MAERNRPLPEITRNRLNARKAIAGLEWVENKFRTEYSSLDLGEIPALKEYAAIQRWKIDKILPSPKQIEVTGDLTTHVIVKFNP